MHKMHFRIMDASECIALEDQVSDSDDDVHKLLWHSIPFKLNKLAPCSYCTARHTHMHTHSHAFADKFGPNVSLHSLDASQSRLSVWQKHKRANKFSEVSGSEPELTRRADVSPEELKPTQTHSETCRKVQRGPTDPSKPAELPKHADQTNIWIKATRYEQVCCFWIRRMDSYCVRISKSIHVKLEMLQKLQLLSLDHFYVMEN